MSQSHQMLTKQSQLLSLTDRGLDSLYTATRHLEAATDIQDIWKTLSHFSKIIQATHYAFYLVEDIGSDYSLESDQFADIRQFYKRIQPKIQAPSYLTNLDNEADWKHLFSKLSDDPPQSLILVPLDVQYGRAQGLILFGHKEANKFSDALFEQIKHLSTQVIITCKHLLSSKDAQESLHEAQILINASRVLSSSSSLDDVYRAMGQIFLQTGADKCTLGIYLDYPDDELPTQVQFVDIRGSIVTNKDKENLGRIIRLDDSSDTAHRQPLPSLEKPAKPLLAKRYPYLSSGWVSGHIIAISNALHDSNLNDEERAIFQHFDIRAQANIPLFSKGKPLGFVLIEYRQPHNFSDRELALLKTVANQTTIAIEHSQQIARTERRARQIQTGAEISKIANSILKHKILIERAVNLIRDGFDFYYVGLFLIDKIGKWAILQAGTGEAGQAQREMGHKLPLDAQSMIGWCIFYKEAKINLDVGKDAVRFNNPYLPLTRSEMALPLISRDIVLGAISIQSIEPMAFSPEDVVTLQTMADQIANALLNSRLFQDTLQAQKETETLYHMSRKIASANTPQEVAEIIITHAPKSHFAYLSIALVDLNSEGKESVVNVLADWSQTDFDETGLSAYLPSIGSALIETLIAQGSLVVDDADAYRNLNENLRQFFQRLRIKSAIVVPIYINETISGTLMAFALKRYPHSNIDITPLQTVAEQAGVAIDRIQKTASLLEANQQYATMVANVPGAVYRAKLAGYFLFQYVSDDIFEITGYPARLFLDSDQGWFYTLIPEEDRGRVQAIHRNQANRQSSYQIQYRFITKSGETKYISEQGKGTFDQQGNLLYIDGILFDMTERETLQRAFQRRATQFEAIAEVGRAASETLDVDLLMSKTVNQINQNFGVYYAGLFLLDDSKEWAVLKAGSGEAGKKMVAEKHRLLRDESSMVGWATYHGQARIALDTGTEAHRFDHPYLPLTRSEIALPLIARGQVIGALDVQSQQQNAFSNDDITTLQLMANQLANVIENARLFETTEQSLQRTNLLYRTTQEILKANSEEVLLAAFTQNLYEIKADTISISILGHSQGESYLEVKHIWSRYETFYQTGKRYPLKEFPLTPLITQPKIFAIHNVMTDMRLTEKMRQHLLSLEVYSLIIIPISIQTMAGTVYIGYKKRPRSFSDDQIRLFESLVQQLSIIWQNLQLLNSIERRYRREQIIREITGKIHSATGVEQILQTTIKEMTKAFNVSGGAIRLNIPENYDDSELSDSTFDAP